MDTNANMDSNLYMVRPKLFLNNTLCVCPKGHDHEADCLLPPAHPPFPALRQEPEYGYLRNRHGRTIPLTVHSEEIHGTFVPNIQRDCEAFQATNYLQKARNDLLTAHPGNAMNPKWPECQDDIRNNGNQSLNALIGLCTKRNITNRILADLKVSLATYPPEQPANPDEDDSMDVDGYYNGQAVSEYHPRKDTTPATSNGTPQPVIDPALLALDARNAGQQQPAPVVSQDNLPSACIFEPNYQESLPPYPYHTQSIDHVLLGTEDPDHTEDHRLTYPTLPDETDMLRADTPMPDQAHHGLNLLAKVCESQLLAWTPMISNGGWSKHA